MIGLKPRHDAVDVERVRAWQEEHVVAFAVVLYANTALLLLAILNSHLDRKPIIILSLHTIQLLGIKFSLLLHYSLKNILIHALNRTFLIFVI